MNRNRTSSLAVLLILCLSGCINLPDIDPGEPDVPDVEEPLPNMSVRILTPVATTYTNGTVDVSVEVTSGTPEAVDLFAGDELLKTLTSPYTFRWDTVSKPEGNYTLTAKARRGAQTFTSEARQVVVDRTLPQVVLLTPESGASGVRVNHSIQAVISEALDSRFVTNASARLKVNGNDVAVKVKLSPDGNRLILEPPVTMALPAQVEIVLTDGLRDLSGNSLLPLSTGWSWNVPDFLFVDPVLKVAGQRAINPSMQLDAPGRPVIACVANNHGYVQRWTGTSWEQLGGVLNMNPANALGRPSLQLDSAGSPVVAWHEETSNGVDVYVKRWSGTDWELVGSALSAMPGATPVAFPSLQLDAAGNPVVAFMENDGQAWNAYVWRWNGSAWEAIGGALSAKPGKTHVKDISLRLDLADNPVVAWRELGESSFDTAYVSRWVDGQWKMLGSVLGPSPGAAYVDDVSLALDRSGNPMIGLYQGVLAVSSGLYVLQWTGDQWQPLGGLLVTGAWAPSLQADATGRPSIALTREDGIHVMRWTDTAWESLGGNLRAYPDYSAIAYPVLQLNSDGYPVVAWGETLDSDGGVYVASFNY